MKYCQKGFFLARLMKNQDKKMVDLAKCMGDYCNKKDKCYRFTSKSNLYSQIYLMPEIIDCVCNDFIDNTEKKEKE
jgi:hypothetical protein